MTKRRIAQSLNEEGRQRKLVSYSSSSPTPTQEGVEAHPTLTVEKTVKPLKSGENVVPSEHNNNGPQKRSGGDRDTKYHLEQAQKGGIEVGMKSVASNKAIVIPHALTVN